MRSPWSLQSQAAQENATMGTNWRSAGSSAKARHRDARIRSWTSKSVCILLVLCIASCGGGGGGSAGGAGSGNVGGGGGGGNNADVIYIGGTVYRCTPNVNPGPGTPTVAGAHVSSTLDGNSTVTDGSGNFMLVTTAAAGKNTAWTLTLTAAGYPMGSVTGQGDHLTGGVFCLMPFTGTAVRVAPISLPLGQTGTAYPGGVQLQTQGGLAPFTWSLAGGTSLPTGMSLTSTGLIQGTPAADGRRVFTVQVTDNVQMSATATMSIVIQPAPITTNNGALSGSYAFALHGFDDATGLPIRVLGSISADGHGTITGGVEDIVAPAAADTALGVPVTGAYSVNASDNRGTLTLTGNGVTRQFSIALRHFSAGVAANVDGIETDDANGTTGQRARIELEQQTVGDFLVSRVAGNYAFALGGFSGVGNGVNRQLLGGTLHADGSATWTGIGDFNRLGIPALLDNTLSGTFGAPDATYGRALAEITYTGPVYTGTYTGVMYMVSARRLLFTSTDNTRSGVLSGHLQLQNFGTATIDNTLVSGALVSYLTGSGAAGGAATNTSANVSVFVADGRGGLIEQISDHSDSGFVTAPCTVVSNTNSYAVDANAHVTVPANSTSGFRAYLFGPKDGFLVSLGATPALGFVYAQQATALTAGIAYSESMAPGGSSASIQTTGVAVTTASASPAALGLTTTAVTSTGAQQTGTTAINLAPAQASGCYADNVGTRGVYVLSPTRFLMLDLNSAHVAPVIRDFQQ
jgi:hypothetical protein